MAFRRSYRSRPRHNGRRRGGRRPKYTTSGSVAHLAKKAWGMAKWVKSVINTEFKYFDTYQNTYTGVRNNAYLVVPLTNIPQGDDSSHRNGRSILAKNSNFQFNLQLNGTCDNAVVRCLILIDWAADGAAPTMSDIYDTITGDDAVNSFRNIGTGTTKRYKILWTKTFSMDKDFKSTVYHSVYRDLQHHIKFVGTDGTQASMGQGSMYFCAIGTGGTAANLGADILYKHRFRFIDN